MRSFARRVTRPSAALAFAVLALALASSAAAGAQSPPAPATPQPEPAQPAPAAAAPTPDPARPERRLVFSGELGARLEYIANDAFAESDARVDDDERFRQRFRLRLGADYQATRRIGLGFRLSTGDPRFPPSAFISLSNDFKRQPISLDRAFVSVRAGRADLRAGIMAMPVFTATQVLWDADVQPAGLSELVPLGSSGFTLAAGQFWLREARSDQPDDQQGSLLFAQSLSYGREGPKRRWSAGAAYWHYNRPNPLARALQTGELDPGLKTNRFDPEGSTIPDPARPGSTLPVDYFSDYSLLSGALRFEQRSKRPLVLSAEAVVNLGARSDPSLGTQYAKSQGRAFAILLQWGSDRKPWDVRLGAGYAHIEADAVMAVYNSDELQQTNVRSVPLEALLTLPGGPRLLLDAFVQKKLDVALPGPGGIVSPENATKVRVRINFMVPF